MVAPERADLEQDTLTEGLLKDLVDKADLKRLAGKRLKPKNSFDAVTNVSCKADDDDVDDDEGPGGLGVEG